MRIEGPSRRVSVGSSSGTRNKGAGRPLFQIDDTQASSQTYAAEATSAPTEIDALLALQAVEDPLLSKRKAIRRGQSLLDTLEALKVDLLAGQVSEERLGYLLSLVRQARERVDPELEAVIEEIELRAMVELAKYGHYISRTP